MFHKPFRLKTQTAIKGSERKRIRTDISKLFSNLTQDDLLELIPAKREMTVAKIYTHSGDSLILYCVQKNPIFIEIFKELIPTVYALWKFPELLPIFRTWPPVFSKLKGGADLMLPGVCVEGGVTPYTFGKLQKGDLCSVCLHGNIAPVAVGRAALSGSDMFESAMRGKGVQILHILGDELWAFGDKSQLPDIPDDMSVMKQNGDLGQQSEELTVEQNSEMDQESGNTQQDQLMGPSGQTPGLSSSVNNHQSSVEDIAVSPEEKFDEHNASNDKNKTEEMSIESNVNKDLEGLNLTGEIKNSTDDPSLTGDGDNTLDNMDELLDICFKCALKSSVKKSDLPLLTSSFFKNHMVKYCPPGKVLDVKKSSYKKLSKYLQKMQKEGYIKIKELSKGADSVVEVDKSQLRDFVPPFNIDSLVTEPTPSETDFIHPKLTEMYSVTAAVISLFKGSGHRKGSAVSVEDIRSCINEYVRSNNLQDEKNKRQVQLDPALADIVLTKGEYDITYLSWEDMFKRLINKMQPVLCIEYPDKPPIYQKGKVDGIKLDIQQRASNKKVTLVENIETFGIDPKELAHTVQVAVACSSAITQLPQKNKGVQIVIQGNQINFVADLLLTKYKVPRKYIHGLEKASKKQ